MAPDMEAVERHINGFAESAEVANSTPSPYETNPASIPSDDPFLAQSVHYGRYTPQPDEFTPRYQDWHHPDSDTTDFWQEVVQRFCTPEHSLNVSGPREAFAAGSVVIQVDRESADSAAAERYSCVNANELSAARKADESLKEIGVAVPVIHFCGTIEGRNVTVESRIPGVSLEVAWRYLNLKEIAVFKNQCRQLLQRLRTIHPALNEPSYVYRGLNSQTPPAGRGQERTILFADKSAGEDLCFTHNNLVPGNIVVKDGRIVGLAGWRESGYFGLTRAQQVHQSWRDLQGEDQDSATGTWVDLYDEEYDPSKSTPLVATKDIALPSVKTEPTSSTLDKFPVGDDFETKSMGYDGAGDYPTSKKLANLRNGTTPRASSSERSSPATSVKPAANKKATSATAKKGTAKKPAVKKRKANDVDADSVDGRSNTPASRASKGPGKKQGSASIAGSPAPEEKKKKKKGGKKKVLEEDEDDDVDDPNEVFCICRRPDNHTWMIGCDGDCEDWYHGKCVNVNSQDEDLIERYICPNCEANGQGRTTWKPMCRLPQCRKPARANPKNPSKYCSDEHGLQFMRQHTRRLKLGPAQKGKEDLGSMGGVLTAKDLKAVIVGVSSVEEFRRLGDRIITPPPTTKENTPNSEVKSENGPQIGNGFDAKSNGVEYSIEEATQIEKLRKHRDDLIHRKEMLAVRSTFMELLRPRAKVILDKLKQKEPKGGWKDICGFDSRLSWSDEEFDEWRLSEAGKKALAEGTAEAMAASFPVSTDADGDTTMDGESEDEIAFLTRGACTKKRCEQHKQWLKVLQQDLQFEVNTTDDDLARCEQEARAVAERSVLRKWAEKENVASEAR
ncbi:hypothetical protein N7532_003939 [Penicillium argentinense]|uniref:PHD-type domain-containing protein n=1 Tax=Penicillium argentinense TaxID=1131581 RepID=A0A9W9KEC5_9EURO|nr:uncharacterized protein N7532_003939 [Penicillium argentinense]KAJ5103410.1 hypothetical protein N7532_003939 [Penicillium argentinense]